MAASSEFVIDARNLGKSYRIWKDPAARLKAPLFDALRSLIPAPLRPKRAEISPYFHDFKALKEVSFTVGRGETLGIIGRNGSGKSTLLQIICGTLQPSSGDVAVNGRVAALLELGSGFNPEFTGRENVFLNASILGVAREEVAGKMDEILAFADIGEFIDQPVKTYSSGMMVRLAFAVSVCVNPDLLIVDEALSVGDIFFQQKCFDRLRLLQERGVSLLFVSHDMSAVRNLCDRCILLNKGDVVFDGLPEVAVSRYYAVSEGAPVVTREPSRSENMPQDESFLAIKSEIIAHDMLAAIQRDVHGTGGMEFLAADFRDESHSPVSAVSMMRLARIRLLVKAGRQVRNVIFGLHLYDRMNTLVFSTSSDRIGSTIAPFSAGEERVIEIALEWSVQPGQYTFSLGCAELPSDKSADSVSLCRMEALGPVQVVHDANTLTPFFGVARLPMTVSEVKSDAGSSSH